MTYEPITITFDRGLLEHRDARHIRTIRASIWLYLELLAALPAGETAVAIEPRSMAERMGLPEGTIRSWLGHLRKAQYINVERMNGAVRVTIRGMQDRRTEISTATKPVKTVSPSVTVTRAFTAAGLARSLGDSSDPAALANVIETVSDDVIRTALAKTLAVPAEDIRRSRTALFIYLIKRHAQEVDNPRA